MKLDYIKIAGFRGFSSEFNLEFSDGFTILTGRNGAGKSSVIDAIEFALTGSITTFSPRFGFKENINRHIWWEGENGGTDQFVEIGFRGDDGKVNSIRRVKGKSGISTKTDANDFFEIKESFSDWSQLAMQNSLIRGESLTTLNMKITSEAREDLIHSFLSDTVNTKLSDRMSEIKEYLEIELNAVKERISKLELELNNVLSNITKYDKIYNKIVENIKENNVNVCFDACKKETNKANDMKDDITIEIKPVSEFIEDNSKKLRSEIDENYKNINNITKNINVINMMIKTLDDLTKKMIIERISTISPLLQEIYARLKPHQHWTEIELDFNDEIQKSVNLKVDGSDLNYLFSSGQRKIAALTFMLGNYFSRVRTNWNTLILDDPYDHIDQLKSFKLTEVISAIIEEGHQVILAIENESLAKFASRRLRNSGNMDGSMFKLSVDSNGIVRKKVNNLHSWSKNVLITGE